MCVQIENLVTSGTFSLDGGTWDVDNNVWIVGNSEECVIIDSPHDATAIINQVRGAALRAIHTPGHSPGSTCFYLESEGTVFTGDTLFNGGPGATGRSYSDYPTILTSIREKLLTLPAGTVVRTGHGDNTTIGAERETLARLPQ